MLRCRAFGWAVAPMLLVGCEQIVGITDLSVRDSSATDPLPDDDSGNVDDAPDADVSEPDAEAPSRDAADDASVPPSDASEDADGGVTSGMCEKLEACCNDVPIINRSSCNDAAKSKNENVCAVTYSSLGCS